MQQKNIEWKILHGKKQNTKVYILHDSIYMKFNNYYMVMIHKRMGSSTGVGTE